RPRRRPPAAESRREKAAKDEARRERHPPRSAGQDGGALKVRRRQDEAAEILEARRYAKPPVHDEQERERDRGDAGARERPVDRREAVEDQREAPTPTLAKAYPRSCARFTARMPAAAMCAFPIRLATSS